MLKGLATRHTVLEYRSANVGRAGCGRADMQPDLGGIDRCGQPVGFDFFLVLALVPVDVLDVNRCARLLENFRIATGHPQVTITGVG